MTSLSDGITDGEWTMTQNIYDNEEFFEGYSRLGRSVEGLDGAPEWPALRALLPDLRGLNVLDLGCGFGWFCRWARQKGAAHVLGIDVSERMLARSRATTQDTAITYTRADMEHLELSLESFNFVYSSLALHYIEDLNEAYVGSVPVARPRWELGLLGGAPDFHCSRRSELVPQCRGS